MTLKVYSDVTVSRLAEKANGCCPLPRKLYRRPKSLAEKGLSSFPWPKLEAAASLVLLV